MTPEELDQAQMMRTIRAKAQSYNYGRRIARIGCMYDEKQPVAFNSGFVIEYKRMHGACTKAQFNV